MDDKKHPTQPDGSQQSQKNNSQNSGEANSSVGAGPSRRIFAKRWLYPAIYLGAAALIIGLMYVRSQMASHPTMTGGTTPDQTGTGSQQPAATEPQNSSNYEWPVASTVTPVMTKGFFQSTGTPQQQATELVRFGGGYSPHLGYDIKAQDGQPFNVTASIAGQVTKIGHSDLNNYTVEVLSNDGNLEKYESLGHVNVQQGESIQQGDVIGTAGTSQYEQSQGNHVYFEVDKSEVPVDPGTLLPKL